MDMPRAFMSHSHEDNDFAVRLARDIRDALGDEDAVWYDSDGGLVSGETWWSEIIHEIEARPVFIVVLSPDALVSKWVIDEVNMAWQLKNSAAGKTIIPVKYRDCQPRQDLSSLQITSFVPPHQYDVELGKVLDAIRRVSQQNAGATPGSAHGASGASARTDQSSTMQELVRRECQRNLEQLKAIHWRVIYEPPPEGTIEEVAFEKSLRLSRISPQSWERSSVATSELAGALFVDELDHLNVLHARLGRFNELQREMHAKFDSPGAQALVASYRNWRQVARGSGVMYLPELSGRLIHFNADTQGLFAEWEVLCNEVLQRGNPINSDEVPQVNNPSPSTPQSFSPAFASEDDQRAFYESVQKQSEQMGPPIFRKDMKF